MATPPSVPTLYHVQWFSSSMPYQVLLELDIPPSKFAVQKITDVELKTAPFIEALSPRRVCPFMALPDGSALVESAAIVMYILENFDTTHKLHPPIGHPNRARFFQGLVFAVAEGYKTSMGVFFPCYNVKKEDRDRAVLEPAKQKFVKDVIGHLEKEVVGDFYLGDEFSAVDVMMGYVLMTAEFVDEGLVTGKAKEYHDRLIARASYKKLYSPEAMA